MILIFLCIQVIQPTHNSSEGALSTDISEVVIVPKNVHDILKVSCYDCHSNKTEYTWYSWVQPGASFRSYHITKGKNNLNFSEFGSYSKRKQAHKLQSIIEQVKNELMPIATYTAFHKKAKLSVADKDLITVGRIAAILKTTNSHEN
ncbi:heme-binding domain-containing protein [Flavipsychrobacter stenotrophus]|nr:heme-binding domain-containing protein [Flavipsychrobacter stenotrophus]